MITVRAVGPVVATTAIGRIATSIAATKMYGAAPPVSFLREALRQSSSAMIMSAPATGSAKGSMGSTPASPSPRHRPPMASSSASQPMYFRGCTDEKSPSREMASMSAVTATITSTSHVASVRAARKMLGTVTMTTPMSNGARRPFPRSSRASAMAPMTSAAVMGAIITAKEGSDVALASESSAHALAGAISTDTAIRSILRLAAGARATHSASTTMRPSASARVVGT